MPIWHFAQSETICTLSGRLLIEVYLTVAPVCLKLSIDTFQVSFVSDVIVYYLKLVTEVINVNILHSTIKVYYLKV